jgi:hypothetical protein
MRTAGAQVSQAMQAHVASRLQTKRRSFVTSFRHRVYARDKRRPPLLILSSSIPWVGLHESGGSIAGRMLIPFGPHIGRQRFRQIIDALMRAGNAWFQRSPNGRVLRRKMVTACRRISTLRPRCWSVHPAERGARRPSRAARGRA